MSEAYLYTVNPKKTITGLSGTVKFLRTPKSLLLTKEDLILCLKYATVYRRFANEGIIERVTIADVDRVHREKYISEKDWPAFVAQEKSAGHATVKVEEDAPVVKEEPKKEETPVVEPVKEEAPVVEETVVEEAVVESDDDEVVEKVEVEE